MLKLFRRIRQKLISKGNLKRYFLYVFGEIVLVVLGILIALQINNWNENRKDRKLEQSYLHLLVQDLRVDSVSLAELVISSNASALSKNIILDYQAGIISKPDSLSTHFLRATFIGVTSFVPNKGAIEEIQNAGGLSLLKNEHVRNQILKLYNEYDRMERNVGSNYLENRFAMRDLVYSKANGKLFITNESIDEELLHRFIFDSELRNRLINNWALTYNNQLTELAELNDTTIEICKKYLQKFKH